MEDTPSLDEKQRPVSGLRRVAHPLQAFQSFRLIRLLGKISHKTPKIVPTRRMTLHTPRLRRSAGLANAWRRRSTSSFFSIGAHPRIKSGANPD